MDPWPSTPPPEPYRPPPTVRAGVPWTVTTVSVFLWIGVVYGAVLVLALLGSGSDGDTGILLFLAALLVANMVLNGVCAVKIRHGSRAWRNVTIVLLVLSMLAELFQLPFGLLGIALGAVLIGLLSTESSQTFFDSHGAVGSRR